MTAIHVSETRDLPRLFVGGVSGSSGKTIVAMSLLLLLRRAGVAIRAFKKGPDYIDPAWLEWISKHPARNLDTYLMRSEIARASFMQYAITDGVNVIEGNRGLFDGFDVAGTHSSAALAETLDAPIILVVDATKMTRTAAAVVLGCVKLDPRAKIRGVVLNNVNGQRHEEVLRSAIESACGVRVVGAIPRSEHNPLPERHLGLIPPMEHDLREMVERNLLRLVDKRIDLEALISIAREASPLESFAASLPALPDARGAKIGYLRDSAFVFYYPENLEELQRGGAELVRVSALEANVLPADLNALYIGGGFPETHVKALSANKSFLESLHLACASGLPVYAECGGLMLLARSLSWRGMRYPMADVFPVDIEAFDVPQGHGYTELRVDTPNPFFSRGTTLRGHEFHYSRIVSDPKGIRTASAVLRGAGCFPGRELLVTNNVAAGYSHFHTTATPEWAKGILVAARNFARKADCLVAS